MKLHTYSIKNKFDYFFLILLVIVGFSGLYVNQNRKDFIDLTDQLIKSNRVKENLYNISRIILTENAAHRNLNPNSGMNGGKELKSVSVLFSNLETLGLFLQSHPIDSKQFDSLTINLKSYFKVTSAENISYTKAGYKITLLNDNSLFNSILDNLSKLEKRENARLNHIIEIMNVTKQESYTASVFMVIFIISILTAFYLKIRYDIRVREKTEKELWEKSVELDLTNKNKEKLFSIIAHDLRSPFHPILTVAEILQLAVEPIDKKEINELGQKLKSIGDGVLNLLDNLLAWSRIQTGTITINSELFPLREKTELALANLKMLSDRKGISIYNQVGENLWIISDCNILTSLIQNLVSNAIKFTPPGGTINIKGQIDQDQITISVSDTGIGISKGNLDRIFDSSSLFTTSGTNQERGSGLGLLLCKDYVGLHQGKIWVESEVGKGSTFYFTIPVKIISQDEHTYYFKVRSVSYGDRKSKNLISVGV
jgi:signal transduction histidine kinase